MISSQPLESKKWTATQQWLEKAFEETHPAVAPHQASLPDVLSPILDQLRSLKARRDSWNHVMEVYHFYRSVQSVARISESESLQSFFGILACIQLRSLRSQAASGAWSEVISNITLSSNNLYTILFLLDELLLQPEVCLTCVEVARILAVLKIHLGSTAISSKIILRGISVLRITQFKSADSQLYTYNTLLGFCSFAGQWKEGLVLFAELLLESNIVDMTSWRFLIGSCLESEKYEVALLLLQRLVDDRSIVIDARSLDCWLYILETKQEYSEDFKVVELVTRMYQHSFHLAPQARRLTFAAKIFLRLSYPTHALTCLSDIFQGGLKYLKETYLVALETFSHHHQFPDVMRIYSEARRLSIEVPEGLYTKIIQDCEAASEWAVSCGLLEDLLSQGREPEPQAVKSCANTALHCNQLDIALFLDHHFANHSTDSRYELLKQMLYVAMHPI